MNLYDNSVTRALGRLVDFVFLNLLWLVCSLPIVTIGASTAALYSVMLKLVKNEEGYIVKGFLKGFKENFVKATIVWIGIIAASIILALDFRVVRTMDSPMQMIFTVGLTLGTIFVACISIYVFPLLARYENTIRHTIKNALILSVIKLPYTFVMLLLVGGSAIVTFLTVRTLLIGIMFWTMIGVALLAWVNSHILRRVFRIFEQ